MTKHSEVANKTQHPIRVLQGDDALTFHAVDHAHLRDFFALFESPGAPKFCWCMVWRAKSSALRNMDNAARKSAITQCVQHEIPVGILAYLHGKAIAWCSIAPRETYRNLGGLPVQAGENVWSLVCFFIKRDYRGLGLSDALLRAAVRYARDQGATAVEAYPVDSDAPSYRFMGFVPLFVRAGFIEQGRVGTRRHVMRLEFKH